MRLKVFGETISIKERKNQNSRYTFHKIKTQVNGNWNIFSAYKGICTPDLGFNFSFLNGDLLNSHKIKNLKPGPSLGNCYYEVLFCQ